MNSRTLHSFLTEYALRHPDRKLLGDPNGWLTASQLVSRVEDRAESLRAMGAGGFVALRAYRNAATVIDILALQLLGAAAVLTDPRHEVPAFLEDTEIPVSAVIDGNKVAVLTAEAAKENDPQAPGFLIFTSGSTG